MTAHTGPPDRRRGPAPTPDPSNVEVATTDTAAVTIPRWTGCPMGCDGRHDHPRVRIGRCNHCLSLDWASRESLYDCSSVCPLLAVVA